MEEITLKDIALFISGGLFFMTFLWGFLYIQMNRRFNGVYKLFEVMAIAISEQHHVLSKNQKELHKSLSDQHIVLENSIRKEKEVFNENDYH